MEPGPSPRRRAPVQQAVVGEDGLATIRGELATLSGIRSADAGTVSYTRGAAFDTVCFGPGGVPVEHNSLLLVPNLLSRDECDQLVAEVEQFHGVASEDNTCRKRALPRRRVLLKELSELVSAMFYRVLRERLLPMISSELSAVESYIWDRSETVRENASRADLLPPLELRVPGQGLGSLPYRFSQFEPAVNRYAAGGDFPPHIDGHALTLNVLLEPSGRKFEGGGTCFWDEDGGGCDKEPTVLVQPTTAGTVRPCALRTQPLARRRTVPHALSFLAPPTRR
jgi:hypothetical protein